MNHEEQCLNMARSLRIGQIARDVEQLWQIYQMRPTRLTSDDWTTLMNVRSTVSALLSAYGAHISTSHPPKPTGDNISASEVHDIQRMFQSSEGRSLIRRTEDVST